jgi:WD40 repeat protein
MTPDDSPPIDDLVLDELLALDAAMSALGEPGHDRDWVGQCLHLLEWVWPAATGAGAGVAGFPLSFGRFEVVGEVGRGGFGVVYRARDRVLGRDVALKVPRLELLATAGVRRRFMREARAAAVLDHPNIVPVFEANELGPVAYIASAYCDGPSLSTWLKARHEPVPARAAAGLVATLAAAVQHAHDRGILHRDLKPSNVMLQALGAPGPADAGAELSGLVPRVTDFGLAKLAEDDGDETRSGVPLGSPPYMAPELAAGRTRDLGPATDVYALGATLYEVLTGRAPFRGETQAETLRQVLDDDPLSPRVLRPDVPRDLETVCLRCLNKDAARRYPTASALADDLERFLAGRPIRARPASAWERGRKWARRRPAQAALVALAVFVAAASAGGMAWSNAWLRAHNERLRLEIERADRHAAEAERQGRLAADREALADRHLHAAQLRFARQACDVGQFERAQEVLQDDVNGPGPGHRDFAWWYLWRFSRREVALLGRLEAPVRHAALSPDGKTLASSDATGGIILWDPVAGRARAALRGYPGAADRLAFSPDGRVLASSGLTSRAPNGTQEVELWDVAGGRLIARLDGAIAGPIESLAFLGGGRLLSATSGGAGGTRTVWVWDLAPDPTRSRLRNIIAGLVSVVPSPDGRFLAAREPDGRLTLRDPYGGGVTRTVSADEPDPSALAVSPDGRRLAVAGPPDRVVVWDLEDGEPPRTYRFGAPLPGRLTFSPNGSLLVAEQGGWRASLLELATGRERALVSLDPARVGAFNVAFSPDGCRLALDGYGLPGGALPAAVWRVATGSKEKVFPGRRTAQLLAFAADGRSLFLGGGHDLSVWRPEPAADFEAFTGHNDEVWAVAFSPDGKTVASGGDDEALRLWDPSTGRERAVLWGHAATVSAVAFRPDGHLIASAGLSLKDNVNLWDAATGRPIATLSGHTERARSVAFSPDGGTLASAGSDRTIRLWDGTTGQPRAVLTGHTDVVRQVAFSPDGLTLASAGNDRTVRLWDVLRRSQRAVLSGTQKVSSVAFSPDGLTLASADEDGVITLWDLATEAPRQVINGDDEELRALAFSPDGRALASAGGSRTVRLWDPVTGQELLALGGSLGQVNALAFSLDGGTLASADHAGSVRVYRGDPE